MIDANDWSWDQHYETGRQCLERKSFDEAEAALVSALRLAEEFGENDPRLPQTLNMLARVHRAQRRFVAAAAMLQQLAALLERTVGGEHPQLAGVLANLAELYAVMGEREEELALRERVLDLRRRLGENDSAIVAKMEERIAQYQGSLGLRPDSPVNSMAP